jgi:outer membrane protein assembly factor BamB
MPVGDAATRAAAVTHAAAAVRGAAAGREWAAHDPDSHVFTPVAEIDTAHPLPHRPPHHGQPATGEPSPVAHQPVPIREMPAEFMPGPRTRRRPGSSASPSASASASPSGGPSGRSGGEPSAPPVAHQPVPIREMPADLMPTARPQPVVAARAPGRPSLGSAPLGPIELRDRRGRGRAKLGLRQRVGVGVLVPLVVLVLALGAAATLWFLDRPSGDAVGDLAPDIAETPVLGDPFDIADAVGADFEGADIRLVSASPQSALNQTGVATMVLVAARLADRTVVVRVDTDSGRAQWKLDLAELTGDSTARLDVVWPANGGGAVLRVTTQEGVDSTVLSVSANGEVLAQRDGVRLLGVAGGLVAMRQGDRLVVAAVGDLGEDQWGASPAEVDTGHVLGGPDGAVWVLTQKGYADGATGRAAGVGADAVAAEASYDVLAGGELLRVSDRKGITDLMAISPETGKDVWADSLSLAGPAVVRQAGGRLFTQADGQVKCLRSADGQVLWSRPADRFIGVVGATAFVAAQGGQISALKAATGGLEYQFEVDSDGSADPQILLGSKTLYVLGSDVLRAYPLEAQAEPLWTLALPTEPDQRPALFAAGGRLWLLAADRLRPIN